MARRTTCVYEQIDGHECPDAPFRQSWCRPCLQGEVERLRAKLQSLDAARAAGYEAGVADERARWRWPEREQ